ncbi:hypothetical protein BASA83_008211 [Batrachochytrium salamandrivorans]|nr:hypothetical protein BASA83_008211 [Batrachochytrium salamandrivorans]
MSANDRGVPPLSRLTTITYNLLSDDRTGRLVFPPTTLAQKEVILSNVKNALAIWANYKSKIAHYGPAADPFPTIKNLRRDIKTITDEELQLGITDAFVLIRDKHTSWTNMAPYGCFHATTGVEFSFIEGDPDMTKKPTVVVTSTSKSPIIHPLFGKDYFRIKAGDELLAINGLSFVRWFKQNKFKSGAGGANVFGGHRAALDYLTTIYGESNRLPSDDFITFKFKSRADPQNSYTVNVQYVSGRDEECWNLGSKLYKSLPSITLPGTSATSLLVSAEQSEQSGHNQESDTAHPSTESHKTDGPEDSEREADIEKRSSFGQESAVSLNPTDVTEVTWGIYKSESTNMGIIKLDSFDPEDVDTKSLAVQKAVMIIRSLLANELKDTNSVMYDLRGNPGGSAEFANSLVQLFKPDFQPFGERYLMNEITFDLFVDGIDPNVSPYAKAWKETKAWQETKTWKKTKKGNRFTNVFSFTRRSLQTPLARLISAPWESSMMQGATLPVKYSLVASRDTVSGPSLEKTVRLVVGGAVVMELDPLLIRASPDNFQKFPFSKELTSGSKTYANTLTWSDLELYPTTNTQYDRIAASLARIGLENGQSKLHFVCEPFSIEKPISGFPLEVEAAGIEKLTVLQADGKTVAAQQKIATTKQKLSIPVSTVGNALGNSHITIVGKTAGKQVLKTNRNVRIIPSDENHMRISTTGFTFAGTSDSVGLYQPSTTAPADGWNNLKGSWMIGNGVKYAKNVESCLEAFFTASVGTKINIGLNVDLDTERFDSDFLYLSVKSSGGVEDFLLGSKSLDGKKTFNGISGREMLFEGIFPFTTKSKSFCCSQVYF